MTPDTRSIEERALAAARYIVPGPDSAHRHITAAIVSEFRDLEPRTCTDTLNERTTRLKCELADAACGFIDAHVADPDLSPAMREAFATFNDARAAYLKASLSECDTILERGGLHT